MERITCKNCGAEQSTENLFCVKCGTCLTLKDTGEPKQPQYSPIPPEPKVGQDASRKQSVKGLVIAIGAIVVVLVALIAVALTLLLKSDSAGIGGGTGSSAAIKYAEPSLVDPDGNMYFTSGNELLRIEGNASQARKTPDGKNIIILEKDGTLYKANSRGQDKEKIAEQIDGIRSLQDSGFLYMENTGSTLTVDEILEAVYLEYTGNTTREKIQEVFDANYPDGTIEDAIDFYEQVLDMGFYEADYENYTFYRYLFASGESLEFDADAYVIASNAMVLLFQKEDQLYLLEEKDLEPVNIGSLDHPEATELLDVNPEGRLAVWSDGDEIMLYEKGEDEPVNLGSLGEIGEAFIGYSSIDAQFANSGKDLLIYGTGYSKLFIKQSGKDVVTVEMDYPMYFEYPMSTEGFFYKYPEGKLDQFYVLLETDSDAYECSLYCVYADGAIEKVRSSVYELTDLYDGYLVYLAGNEDGGDDVCWAKLKENTIQEKKSFAGDWLYTAELDRESGYIYYRFYDFDSDYSMYASQLYRVKLGDMAAEPELVTDCCGEFFTVGGGDALFYIQNPVDIGDTYYSAGDLYIIRPGQESEKIAEDVITIGVDYRDELYADGVLVQIYAGLDEDGEIVTNMGYYNGETYEEITRNVTYIR